MNFAVIMAGGSGTRLWPMSRVSQPKQFQKLVSNETLLQRMYKLVARVLPSERIFIMAPQKFEEEILKELPELKKTNFIFEPSARDNGPACTLATLKLWALDKEANVAILWSDHLIGNPSAFENAFKLAFSALKDYPDFLITIGVKPTEPDTTLGYIKMGKEIKEYPLGSIFRVLEFKEKPDLETAKTYLTSWEYLWNTGYKIYKAKTFIKEFVNVNPELEPVVKKIQEVLGTSQEEKVVKHFWDKFPKMSIEYLLTNKLKKILVIPTDLEWSDIGNWQKLYSVLSEQNAFHMVVKGHHIGFENERCLIYSSEKMIATLGLKDLIVVETEDVIFIADRQKSLEVKKIIDRLKEEGKHIYL